MKNRKVLHADGKTVVIAKGRILDKEFIGEYNFEGMSYGITIPVPDFNLWLPISFSLRQFIYDINPSKIKIKTANKVERILTLRNAVWNNITHLLIEG